MKRMDLLVAVPLLSLGAMTSLTQAATLFAQTPAVTNGVLSDRDNGNEFSDDFSIASPATAGQVTWRGYYAATNTLNFPLKFTLTIYGSNGGLPDVNDVKSSTTVEFAPSGNNVTDTKTTVVSKELYNFSAPIKPTQLTANTTYWFSVLADTTTDTTQSFYWASSYSNGGAAFHALPNGAFASSTAGDLYFTIATPVPEPASLACLAGAAVLMRRRRS